MSTILDVPAPAWFYMAVLTVSYITFISMCTLYTYIIILIAWQWNKIQVVNPIVYYTKLLKIKVVNKYLFYRDVF